MASKQRPATTVTASVLISIAGALALPARTVRAETVEQDRQSKTAPAPVNGLRLTLTADKSETTMLPDGGNAKRVVLMLTFSNVGKKPIKLDVHDFTASHVQLEFSGTDASSIRSRGARINRGIEIPRGEDLEKLPVLKPGESWSSSDANLYMYDKPPEKKALAFPGDFFIRFGCWVSYEIVKPDKVRIQATYINDELNEPEKTGCWMGSVMSNEFVLTVRPAN